MKLRSSSLLIMIICIAGCTSTGDTHNSPNFDMGYKLFEKKQYEQAIVHFTKAIEANEATVGAYLFRGDSYFELDELKNALKDYNSLLKIKPSVAEFYNKRAIVYSELENYKKAMSDFNTALKIKPCNEQFMMNKARLYKLMNNKKMMYKTIMQIEKCKSK